MSAFDKRLLLLSVRPIMPNANATRTVFTRSWIVVRNSCDGKAFRFL